MNLSRRSFLGAVASAAPVGALTASASAAAPAPAGDGAVRFSADVLVCGGGPAGVAAAIAAAGQGARTMLVERYGRLGGMAVQAMVGPLMGRVDGPPLVAEIVKGVGGRSVDFDRLDLDYASLVDKAGVRLLLHAWATAPILAGSRITGVRCCSKQGTIEIAAALTVDATGDGDIAAGAGAAFVQGRSGDGAVQPVSIMYRLAGVDEAKALTCGSEEEARRVRVPGGTWEAVVQAGQAAGELPATIGVIRCYRTARRGERGINATQINGIDGTRVEDLTRAEIEGRRQAATVLEFLRRHAPGYETAYISGMPAIVGVRETRRFRGLATLTREDCIAGRRRSDAVVTGASFPIDIHNPSGSGQAEGTAARVKPYDIPYGCLVPEAVDGLLLAGRCISGTHEAHASYRVQCIAMGTGAAAGAAAALAAKAGVQPRALDATRVRRALGLADGKAGEA